MTKQLRVRLGTSGSHLPSRVVSSFKLVHPAISRPRDTLHSLSPESRFLADCNSTGVLPRKTRQLSPGTLNWQKLLRSAVDYDLPALLYFNIKTSVGCDLIPIAVREQLETIYKRSCVEVMNVFAKLEEVRLHFLACRNSGNCTERRGPHSSGLSADGASYAWISTSWFVRET